MVRLSRVLRSALSGVVLLLVLGGWALLSTPDAPEADSAAAAYVAAACGLVAGVLLGRVDPAVPGLAVLGVAAGAFAVTLPASMSGEPAAPPLNYMNANGAMALCGAAGAVLAARRRSTAMQVAAGGVAVAAALVCWFNGALAAAAAAVLLAAWAVARRLGPAGPWRVLGALGLLLPGLATVLWGAGWLPHPGALVALLSRERFSLWSDAVDALGAEPWTGVGPGRFSDVSPTAADPDLAWAHSYVLQTGAELGVPGLALLAVLLLWAAIVLGRDVVLLAVLLLPATIDYVLHFGGVVVVLSLVVGGWLGGSGTGKPWLTPPTP